jgi:hypothetical protein
MAWVVCAGDLALQLRHTLHVVTYRHQLMQVQQLHVLAWEHGAQLVGPTLHQSHMLMWAKNLPRFCNTSIKPWWH